MLFRSSGLARPTSSSNSNWMLLRDNLISILSLFRVRPRSSVGPDTELSYRFAPFCKCTSRRKKSDVKKYTYDHIHLPHTGCVYLFNIGKLALDVSWIVGRRPWSWRPHLSMRGSYHLERKIWGINEKTWLFTFVSFPIYASHFSTSESRATGNPISIYNSLIIRRYPFLPTCLSIRPLCPFTISLSEGNL